eukprot:16440078-Heterocapsa_arctica.AAC.1
MSWNGQGSGWHEMLLHEPPQFGAVHRVPRTNPVSRLGGVQSEGKREERKGGSSALSGKGGSSTTRSVCAAGEREGEREYPEKETRHDEVHAEERRGNRGVGGQ